MQGTAIFEINFGTEMVQVVPIWWYRNGTGGGPEHDIAFCVVPKLTGTETDHPVVPKWSGTGRYLPLSRQLGYSEDVVCTPPTVLKMTFSRLTWSFAIRYGYGW